MASKEFDWVNKGSQYICSWVNTNKPNYVFEVNRIDQDQNAWTCSVCFMTDNGVRIPLRYYIPSSGNVETVMRDVETWYYNSSIELRRTLYTKPNCHYRMWCKKNQWLKKCLKKRQRKSRSDVIRARLRPRKQKAQRTKTNLDKRSMCMIV